LPDYGPTNGEWGGHFPGLPRFGGDFNPDFNVHVTEEQQRKGGTEYNYVREKRFAQEDFGEGAALFAKMSGTDLGTYVREKPRMSAFALEDGIVYHTCSAYARGLDALWGMYQWLDRAPRGRNEPDLWFRRHDEYGGKVER
jgi:predicted dithiol-disulfide oxidoreductase (DUF899 family)